MNKKILGIIAASAAVIGSAIIAAPADAQTATLDVELEVQPSVYLVTYNRLKFLISNNELQGNPSVSQTVTYDEKALGSSTLPAGSIPTTVGSLTPVVKKISPLYRVAAPSGSTVSLTASTPTLTRQGAGASTGDIVTMSVDSGSQSKTIPTGTTGFIDGDATLNFAFASVPSGGSGNPKYAGGKLTISVATP
jgi:hypothetical protein